MGFARGGRVLARCLKSAPLEVDKPSWCSRCGSWQRRLPGCVLVQEWGHVWSERTCALRSETSVVLMPGLAARTAAGRYAFGNERFVVPRCAASSRRYLARGEWSLARAG